MGPQCEPFVPNTNQAVVAGQLGDSFTKVSILLDLGASNNFIDQAFSNSISTTQFKKPRRITLFDGKPSSARPLREYVKDTLALGGVRSLAKFNVTILSGLDIVFGYSRLQENGAVLDFENLTVSILQRGAEVSTHAVTKVAVSQIETATPVVMSTMAIPSHVQNSLNWTNSSIETFTTSCQELLGFDKLVY